MSTAPEPLEVVTPEGYTVNLAPLVYAAQGIRRNALQDAERESRSAISRKETAFVLMGMRIAVKALCGADAADVFEARLSGPLDTPETT